jgi:hypothetical protein
MNNESNFKCLNCDKEYHITNFIISQGNSKISYKTKNHKILTCECGEELKSIEKPFSGIPFFGKVSSMSLQDKQKELKKRSSQHFNKEIKEKQHEMHKETINSMKK